MAYAGDLRADFFSLTANLFDLKLQALLSRKLTRIKNIFKRLMLPSGNNVCQSAIHTGFLESLAVRQRIK